MGQTTARGTSILTGTSAIERHGAGHGFKSDRVIQQFHQPRAQIALAITQPCKRLQNNGLVLAIVVALDNHKGVIVSTAVGSRIARDGADSKWCLSIDYLII